jgi:hypothetical protein
MCHAGNLRTRRAVRAGAAMRTGTAMNARKIGRGLGWFSIGLGLWELLGGRQLARMLGMGDREGLIRLFGVREIATGLGIFGSGTRSRWLWARVAGDALDVALLGSALGRDNPRRKAATLALGNVLAVTAMDVACARQLPA